MKLTAFTDYSLRVLMYLATEPAERATIGKISGAFEVSENHMVKVVHFLGKQGWLANVRGKGGGLQLALPPDRISIGQVVRQTEGEPIVADCFNQVSTCRLAGSCRLEGLLHQALTAFYAVLDRYTLQDMVSNQAQLAQILFVPHAAQAPQAKPAPRKASPRTTATSRRKAAHG